MGWVSLQVPREAAGYVEAVTGGCASRPMKIDERTELVVRMGMPVKQHGPACKSCPDDGPCFPEPPGLRRNVVRGRTASAMSLYAEGEEERGSPAAGVHSPIQVDWEGQQVGVPRDCPRRASCYVGRTGSVLDLLGWATDLVGTELHKNKSVAPFE